MFKSKSKFEPQLSRKLIQRSNVPLLILDPVWLNNFPKEHKTKNMLSLEIKIKELMKESSRLFDRQKLLALRKKNYLDSILQLSRTSENLVSREQTAELHKLVLEINEELIALEKRIIDIPEEMELVNNELLQNTVSICYKLMHDCERHISEINPEIESHQKALDTLTAKKEKLQQKVDRTYRLMHDLVGQEILDLLDKEASM